MRSTIGGVLLLLAAGLLFFTTEGVAPQPDPPPINDDIVVNDVVHRVHVLREKLFRKMARQVADDIDSGKLKDPAAIWAAIEAGDLLVIEQSTDEMRQQEAAALTPYSMEKHSSILRGYADGIRDK